MFASAIPAGDACCCALERYGSIGAGLTVYGRAFMQESMKQFLLAQAASLRDAAADIHCGAA